MLSVKSIREQLQNVLAGQVSLDDFEDWLVQASWNMHQHADDESQQLVGAIELHLAELSDGLIDENEIVESLLTLYLHGCYEQGMQVQMLLEPTEPVTTMIDDAMMDDDTMPMWSFMMPGNSAEPAATGITRTSSGKSTASGNRDI